MSALAGGRAEKLGNRYEGLWVARGLLRVLAGEVGSVCVEAIGDDERGVDLWLTLPDGTRDAQQCKRQNRTRGRWSVTELAQEGVLGHLRDQLGRDPGWRFTLVSGDRASELANLTELARTSGGDPEAYYAAATGTQTLSQPFRQFCSALRLDASQAGDRAAAYDLLRRGHVYVFDAAQSRAEAEGFARLLLDGDPAAAVALLRDLAESRLGEPLHADQITDHLRGHGIHPRDLANDPRILPRVEELNHEFLGALRPFLIHGGLIRRDETEQLLDALRAGTAGLVVLHGRAGLGKSGALYGLVERLRGEGVPVLGLRLDTRTPRGSARQYGQECGLPESPALCLAALAGGRPAVLVLDQLDAIRWTAAHGSASWEACRELIDEALRRPNLSVVVACRSFDLRDDQQIRAWHRQRQGREVEVGPLPDGDVEAAVRRAGGDYPALGAAERRLLREPHCLAMWVELCRGGRPVPFATATDLMRQFWADRRDRFGRTPGLLPGQGEEALAAVVAAMDRAGTPAAPARVLEPHRLAAAAWQSLGVLLVAENGRVRFAHQRYFEYLLAAGLVADALGGRRSVPDWLRGTDQSLPRREQLRLLLALLRDDDPALYAAELRATLDDARVRFHLKHLALRFLGDADTPQPAEVGLVLGRLDDPEWRQHVIDLVLWGRPGWFAALDDRGLWRTWLESDHHRDIALRLMSLASEAHGDRVVRLIAPAGDGVTLGPERAAAVLPFDAAADSPGLFDLRLRLVRAGALRPMHWSLQLVECHPGRCAALLGALLGREGDLLACEPPAGDEAFGRPRRLELPVTDREALNRVAAAEPREIWGLLPTVLRLCELTAQPPTPQADGTRFVPDRFWGAEVYHRRAVDLPDLLAAVAAAGAALAAAWPDSWPGLSAAADSRFLTAQRLAAAALARAPDAWADRAVSWLCDCPDRLALGEGAWWGPAHDILQRFGGLCSDTTFARLESALLQFSTLRERESFRLGCEIARAGGPLRANLYGLTQYALLSGLPAQRLSAAARSALGQFRQKYGRPAVEVLEDRTGRHRSLVPPVPGDALARLSDAAWLGIAGRHTANRGIPGLRDRGRRHFAIPDANHFARQLHDLARRQPGRFADLALRFPPDTHPSYLTEVLQALWHDAPPVPEAAGGWAPARPEQVIALVSRVDYTADRGQALAWCHLVCRHTGYAWPAAVLERLARYATDHPDPAPDEFAVGGAEHPDFQTSAINCVRGVAVEAVARALDERPQLLPTFRGMIPRVMSDPSPVVRVAAAGLCLAVWNSDVDSAVEMFLLACETDDRALTTRFVQDFLSIALWRQGERLGPLLRRMVESPRADVARSGASWAAAAWLYDGRWCDLCQECLAGADESRRGVAEAASDLVHDDRCRTRSVGVLARLFDDDNPEVRQAAQRFLFQPVDFGLPEFQDLARRLVASRGIADDPSHLLEALRRFGGSLVPLGDVVLSVCDRFAGPLAPGSQDPGDRLAFAVRMVPGLLLRLGEQAQQVDRADLCRECLDRWDALLRARVGGVRELTAELDRQA